jgi:hypothetical protein
MEKSGCEVVSIKLGLDLLANRIWGRLGELNYLHDLASYTVFIGNDGRYYAKNGDSGAIEFVDTDVSSLLQNVINTLYSRYGGGRIFIKRGVYYPSKSISIPDGINLIIEGEGSNTIFRYTSRFILFWHIPSSPTWSSIVIMRNFKIDRSGSGSNNVDIIVVNYAKLVLYDGIEIVDDWRNMDGDAGLVGYNNLIAIAQNNRVFNKSYGLWLFGYLTILRNNYVENTAKVGIGGAGFLPNFQIPSGYSAGGITVIEDNICVDCGRTDEAIAVDYLGQNPVVEGLGIIRNNLLITRNYSMWIPIAVIGVSHAVVENNKVYGNVSAPIVFIPSTKVIEYLVLRNNVFKISPQSSYIRTLLYANILIVENNEHVVNSSLAQNIDAQIDVASDYLVFRNNRIVWTAPSDYYFNCYVLNIASRGNTDYYAVISDNYIDAQIGPSERVPVIVYPRHAVNHYVWFMRNYLKAPSSSGFIGLSGYYTSSTYYAFIKENVALGSLLNRIDVWNDTSGQTTTAIIDTDVPTVNIRARGIYKYMKKNSGVATFSGDGTTTQFKIAHGLVSTPSKVLVTPASSSASGAFYVTADSTYIYINYATAPPSGTNNIVLYWYAEV